MSRAEFTWKRFIDGVIIAVGLLLIIFSATAHEPIGVVIGVAALVAGVISLVPRSRNV